MSSKSLVVAAGSRRGSHHPKGGDSKVFVLARFLAFTTLLLTSSSCRGSHQGSELRDETATLREQITGSRFLEPRLQGGFRHVRCPLEPEGIGVVATCGRSSTAGPPPVDRDEAPLRGGAPAQTHARAIATLALGAGQLQRLDEAIEALGELAVEGPDRAAASSDLAAAHFVRASVAGKPHELLEAATAARRALELDPILLEARFNRALALERLFLRSAATEAWNAYLELDPASGWADEARQHLRALAVSGAKRDLGRSRRSLLQTLTAPDAETFGAATQTFREEAVNTLFPAWGQAILATETAQAEQIQRLLTQLGRLSSQWDDPWIAHAAAELDTVEPAQRAALAAAHRDVGRARRAYHDSSGDGCKVFDDLHPELERLQSVFAFEALRYRASCAFLAYDAALARRLASELWQTSRRRGFHGLAGKAAWILGSQAVGLGDLPEAYRRYRDGIAEFERIDETGNAGTMWAYLAEAAQDAGDWGMSWTFRYAALRRSESQTRFGRSLAFQLAGRAAARVGHPEVGLLFMDEIVPEVTDDPVAAAESLAWRSEIELLGGRPRAASASLQKARSSLEQITAPEVRRRTEVEILFAECAALLDESPAESLAAADRILEIYDESDGRYSLAEILLRRARALRKLDRPAESIADLERGLKEIERQVQLSRKSTERVRLFDQAARLHTEKLGIELEIMDESRTALATFEASRARLLHHELGVEPASLETTRRAIPVGTSILIFAWLEERVVAWRVDTEGSTSREVSLDAATLSAQIDRFVAALGKPHEARELAVGLYKVLLEPWNLPTGERLVVVPAGPLARLPFAALLDANRQRFVIQDHEIVIAPSASAWLRLTQRANRPRRGAPLTVLAVGDPEFDRSKFPDLLPLPGARQEAITAHRVGTQGSVLLVGPEATVETFLAELPRHPVIHFAGHAVIHPEEAFYSRLLLTPDGDHSGVLWGSKIYEQECSACRLVVISACDSGAGFVSPLEGVLDMAHPFLASGTPQVVTSLRPLDDRDTLEFFRRFYDSLGTTSHPSEALRSAQTSYLETVAEGLQTAAIWSSFQLVGSPVSLTPTGEEL